MKYSLIYITTKNSKQAEKIGTALVKSRLAACVNIIDNMQSIYEWKGNLEKSKEAILIVKTRSSLTKKVIKKVKSLHTYDCPCIISLPIQSGNKAFLSWIGESTRVG